MKFYYYLIAVVFCLSCSKDESVTEDENPNLVNDNPTTEAPTTNDPDTETPDTPEIDTPDTDTQNDDPAIVATYFPPNSVTEWKTTTAETLGWDASKITDLYQFLETNNTRAFIVLKNGKIVLENYWGKDFFYTDFSQFSQWYWASASKTLTAFLTGIAEADAILNIENSSSTYLGEGWSNATSTQESAIKVQHHLKMTTGLDYGVDDLNCTDDDCLNYKTAPGTEWYYYNAPYLLLHRVIANAANSGLNDYTEVKLEDKIGITTGRWRDVNSSTATYWSTARDAARFGLLLANEGKWNNTKFVADAYFDAMTNSSQDLNPSYGYLTWLNGKNSTRYPGSTRSFATSVAPSAPADLIAAMGKDGQFINAVPSENIVVVRFGEAPDDALVPVTFHDQMWQYISAIID